MKFKSGDYISAPGFVYFVRYYDYYTDTYTVHDPRSLLKLVVILSAKHTEAYYQWIPEPSKLEWLLL